MHSPSAIQQHTSMHHRIDSKGHILFELGENLTPRYKIMKLLGEGTFGKVLQCWDRVRSAYVAIKVVRAIKKYSAAARDEIRILEDLKQKDPEDNKFESLITFILFAYLTYFCSYFLLVIV